MSAPQKHPDTARLETLIRLIDETGNPDFEQMLFFARKKKKSDLDAFRMALDQWKEERE